MIVLVARTALNVVTVKIVITVNRVIDASYVENQDDVRTLLSC